VEALLSRIEPFLAPSAKAPEPPLSPDFDDELPVVAARTSTKFTSARSSETPSSSTSERNLEMKWIPIRFLRL
jgi:hypothetical protein